MEFKATFELVELEKVAADIVKNSAQRVLNLTYFHALDSLRTIPDSYAREKLLTASMFAYAWMPTMLDDGLNEQDIAMYLQISSADFHIPQRPLANNSWVGTSKALHFIAPERFAIWDSRVARNFSWKTSKSGKIKKCKVNDRESFVAYLKWIKEFSLQPEVKSITNRVAALEGRAVSAFRAVELLLYYRNGTH